MKIRLAAAILAFISAITLGIICTVYTDRLCTQISSDIESAAQNYDYNALQSTKQHWDRKVPILSAFVPHEHIDEVTEILSRALAFLQNDDHTEFDAEISCVMHQLYIISTYDIPTLRALF